MKKESNEKEIIKNNFKNWPEIDTLFQTSDNRLFIRYEEAISHTDGLLDNTEPLINKKIKQWFEEFSGCDIEPLIRYIEL